MPNLYWYSKMFIRIKRIKKKNKEYPYAYIVANRWMKKAKRSKQKVKKYLGRVYFLEKVNNNDFFEFYSIKDVKGYVKKNDKKRIINDLIRFELINHGFKEQGNFLIKDNIYFNKNSNEVFINIKKINDKIINSGKINDKKSIINKNDNSNNKIVLAMNEGFLCDETIKRLFGRFEGDEREVGFKLANAFVEAGLKIPEELFVCIFEKIVGHYQ